MGLDEHFLITLSNLSPLPTLKSQKSHGKIYALSVLYGQAMDTQGFSFSLSLPHHLSFLLSMSLSLSLSLIVHKHH